MSLWGESPSDFQGESKNVFVNFLIWQMKQIVTELYYGHSYSRTVSMLQAIIDSLDPDSQDKLSKQRENLNAFCLGQKTLCDGELETIYKEVSAFLHGTYLREVRFATPLNPKPQHIRME